MDKEIIIQGLDKKVEDLFAQTDDSPEGITYSFAQRMFELIIMFDRKQKDYGRGNIKDFGRTGILIRMNDKFARIRNLVIDKETGVFNFHPFFHNESIRDSYNDIAVYAVIDALLEEGLW